MRYSACLIGVVLVVLAGTAFGDTIRLAGGRVISGEVLKERADALVVDIGFTVVTVPKDRIVKRQADKPDKTASAVQEAGQIFTVAAPGAQPKESSVKDLVARLGAAVVKVSTPKGMGSGFIIHEDGYVVTNFHVIEGEQEISVTLFHKRNKEFERTKIKKVRIKALNPFLDLALLKLEADKEEGLDMKLVKLPLGDVERVKAGQPAFAIGNPLGLERTVSEGIVSTKKRSFRGILYIQTTAPINPGNSGGPLLNLRGEVIGVTNMKASFFTEGLGFAVPVNYVKDFLRNREAFAFDKDNPNTGFRYLPPPRRAETRKREEK